MRVSRKSNNQIVLLLVMIIIAGAIGYVLSYGYSLATGGISLDTFKSAPNWFSEQIEQPVLQGDQELAERSGITPWSYDLAPNYYLIRGKAFVDEDLQAGQVIYSGVDKLGRSRSVSALVTHDMMIEGSERERSGMADIHPSGWGYNKKVQIQMANGRVYNGYLYNRSHMLAKSLGGADSLENMLTGTRTQNVGQDDFGGMAYTETLARDWLKAHPRGTVFYKVTPLYEGTELLARSVIVDIKSSDGSIDLEVEVFNAARGFTLNYSSGDFAPAR